MKNILFILLIFIAPSTSAEQIWHESTVKTIYPQPSGGFVLVFDTPALNCTRLDNYHFVSAGVNGVNKEGIQNMLSIVLMAAPLKKPINILFDDSSDGCYINRLFVNY